MQSSEKKNQGKNNPNSFYNMAPSSWRSMVLPEGNNIHSCRWNCGGDEATLGTSLSTLCLATSFKFLNTRLMSTFLRGTSPALSPGCVPLPHAPRAPCTAQPTPGLTKLCVANSHSVKVDWTREWGIEWWGDCWVALLGSQLWCPLKSRTMLPS